MTTDCPLTYRFNTWKFQAQAWVRTCWVQKLFLTFWTIFVHNMFSPCSAKEELLTKIYLYQLIFLMHTKYLIKSMKSIWLNPWNAIRYPLGPKYVMGKLHVLESVQHLNLRLHIQTKLQHWTLIKTACSLFFHNSFKNYQQSHQRLQKFDFKVIFQCWKLVKDSEEYFLKRTKE